MLHTLYFTALLGYNVIPYEHIQYCANENQHGPLYLVKWMFSKGYGADEISFNEVLIAYTSKFDK